MKSGEFLELLEQPPVPGVGPSSYLTWLSIADVIDMAYCFNFRMRNDVVTDELRAEPRGLCS
jgi:hypothetical protein